MKNLKKILAVALAVVMMAALSVSMFAATIGSTGKVESTDTTVTFKNVLKAYNPDETSIYAPAVSYAFTIAAASGTEIGQTITDANSVQAVVKAGVGNPTITALVAWTMDNTITAATAGADNNKDITVDFSGVTFPAAGVYRYKITREVTDTNNALEQDTTITVADDKNVRYLDVYVKEVDGVRSIYGYVLHDVTSDITTSTTKSAGFYDNYKTSNLIVSKTLVNDSANNSNKFPFFVTFANTKAAHIKTSNTVDGYSGESTVGTLAAAATSDTPTIAHNGAVKYIGIPNGFTAEVYETNNVTGTTYKSEGAADTAAAAKNITWSSTNDANKSNTASSAAATDENKTIAFTNTLEIISPTGVILRVAPFAIILLAGIALFVIARRRRVED